MNTPQRKGLRTRETKELPESPSLFMKMDAYGESDYEEKKKKRKENNKRGTGQFGSVQAARLPDCCGTQVFRRNLGCSDGTGTRPTPALHTPQGTQAALRPGKKHMPLGAACAHEQEAVAAAWPAGPLRPFLASTAPPLPRQLCT